MPAGDDDVETGGEAAGGEDDISTSYSPQRRLDKVLPSNGLEDRRKRDAGRRGTKEPDAVPPRRLPPEADVEREVLNIVVWTVNHRHGEV